MAFPSTTLLLAASQDRQHKLGLHEVERRKSEHKGAGSKKFSFQNGLFRVRLVMERVKDRGYGTR